MKYFLFFPNFIQKVSNEKDLLILFIQNDHRIEFENQDFERFYNKNDIKYNFSTLRMLQ